LSEPVEDWEYWVRFAKVGRFALAPYHHIFYRFSIDSASAAVERYVRAVERVAQREFSSTAPEFRSRRQECLSNAKQHASLVYLTRTTAGDAYERAGKMLFEAISGYPRSLISQRALALLATWLLLGLVSRSRRLSVTRSLLRWHGASARAVAPEFLMPSPTRLARSAPV
jgi:hypothetical protein